jgi:hypothetical protein
MPALAHLQTLGYGIEERTRMKAVLRLPAAAIADGPGDGIGVTGNAHGDQT